MMLANGLWVKHDGQDDRLSTEKRAQNIGCLVEGMSIRATVRVTGAGKTAGTEGSTFSAPDSIGSAPSPVPIDRIRRRTCSAG